MSFSDTYDIRDYGATTSPSQTPADRWTAMMNCINAAAGQAKVFIPAGTWLISQELKIPSYSYVYGAGIRITVVKLADGVPGMNNVFTNAANDRTVNNAGNTDITITDVSAHTNYANANPQTNGISTSACAFGFAHVTYLRLIRCHAMSARGNHGFDIEASTYSRASGHATIANGTNPNSLGYAATSNGDGTWTSTNADVTNDITYQLGWSQYVWLVDCEAQDWFDDGITTHNSEYVWIVRPYCHDAGSNFANSNGIEIDDGSRYIWIIDPVCSGVKAAVSVKGHENAPAPYDVFVRDIQAFNCSNAFNCYHKDHYGPRGTAGATDVSLTARNIVVDGVAFRDPNSSFDGSFDPPPGAVNIRSYQGVSVRGIRASDPKGTGHVQHVVLAYQGARGISLADIAVWKFPLETDGSAVRVSPSAGDGIWISDVNADGVLGRGIYITGTSIGVAVERYRITGSSQASQDYGVYWTGLDVPTNRLGVGDVEGYANAIMSGGTGSYVRTAGYSQEGRQIVLVGAVVPEGVVSARQGTLYVNTAGGASTMLYVKYAGTSNTGWSAR